MEKVTVEQDMHALTPQEETYELKKDKVEIILQALDVADVSGVREHVEDMHAADVAEFLNVISNNQRREFIEIIRDDFDPEILVELDPDIKDNVVEVLGAEQSAEAIATLEHDDAVQVIEDLEQSNQDEILEAIPQEQRDTIEEGLSYPEESAGRLMHTKYVAAGENWDVGSAIDYLRSSDDLPEVFYSIFVVDKESVPVGSVLISKAIRNNRDVKIKDIMEDKIYTIKDQMDQEEVAYTFRKYALASAPVVNGDGKMVGVITIDDVVDIMKEEAEEDILHLGGVKEADLYAAFVETSMHRFPWLLVNLVTAIAASAVIAMFAASIEQLVALAVLMPIVASMSGNAGTQTLTIAVRSIATKELTETNAKRIVIKEVLASAVNGLLFAGIVGLVSYFYYDDLYLSLVFAFSIAAALILAALSGALVPLGLVRMGVDPAIASGVFLTTITDISSFFIFLGLASIWLL